MKKTFFVAVFAVLVSSVMLAQDFQGVATYKTKRKLDIKLDSTKMQSGMQKQMMEMLKKQFEKTFTLTFDKQSSVYKEEEKLGAPQPAGMQMVIMGSGGSDVLYKNTKENRFTNQNEMYGKVFLVKDKLKKHEWVLGKETKNIGDYTCYNATMTREVEVRQSGFSVDGDKDLDEDAEPKMKTITTTAWYTPQIPISNGPQNYYGLPGLILEVNDGSETVICSKIVMNPKEKLNISEPKKGKEVTQAEYDVISEKKMKEQMERYRPRRGNGDGHSIEIRVGG